MFAPSQGTGLSLEQNETERSEHDCDWPNLLLLIASNSTRSCAISIASRLGERRTPELTAFHCAKELGGHSGKHLESFLQSVVETKRFSPLVLRLSSKGPKNCREKKMLKRYQRRAARTLRCACDKYEQVSVQQTCVSRDSMLSPITESESESSYSLNSRKGGPQT